MLGKQDVARLFAKFLQNYDSAYHDDLWDRQSQTFRSFWQNKVMNDKASLKVPEESDAIVRLLDIKARGHKKDDEAVAFLYVYQNRWDAIFYELKKSEKLRKLLDSIFQSSDLAQKTQLIDNLKNSQKLGLTGARGNALNGLLFLNNPKEQYSVCSLDHRAQVCKAFGFPFPSENMSYGQKIILSNESLIKGFRDTYGLTSSPRTISEFLYQEPVKLLWLHTDGGESIPFSAEEAETTTKNVQFQFESHLEDYIVKNWEAIKALSEKYEILEEDDETVGIQYPAGPWKIDILAKDKKTKQYVIIELKKGKTDDEVVGQLARYITWVREHLSKGKEVKGIVIASENDERLRYALKALPNTELFLYQLKFEISKVDLNKPV